jgi:hypothetical protein
MKKQIIVIGISLSILFLSVSLDNLAAQNLTTNNSNAVGNLSVSANQTLGDLGQNLSVSANQTLGDLGQNLSVSANQTLGDLGQKLSAFVNAMNTTSQSENSSSLLGQNSSDLGIDLLNMTDEAAK